MAVLFASAVLWGGTPTATTVGKTVMRVQFGTLGGMLIPQDGALTYYATTHFISGDTYTFVSHDS